MRNAGSSQSRDDARVILLGCVKLKLDHRVAAKVLYQSPLWLGRRAYAEASGHPWLILSALHELVDPEARLELGARSALTRCQQQRSVLSASNLGSAPSRP